MADIDTSAEPALAPEPTNEAPKEPAKKPQTRDERKEDAAAKLRARFARARAAVDEDDDAPAPAPSKAPAAKPTETPKSAKVEAKVEAIEAAGGEAPDQRKGETDAQYEIRLARALRELKDAQTEARKYKADVETTGKELAKLKSLVERGKMNPLEFLDHVGISFDDLVAGINDDKFKAPAKKAPIDPELQAEIELMRAERKARDEERKKAEEQRVFQSNVAQVADFLKANEDRFPMAASLKGAAETVIRNALASGADNFIPILEHMEAALADDAIGLVGSEKALLAALKKDAGLKDRILKALGVSNRPADEDVEVSKASLSALPTEAPATSKRKLTRQEKAQRALERWRSTVSGDDDE